MAMHRLPTLVSRQIHLQPREFKTKRILTRNLITNSKNTLLKKEHQQHKNTIVKLQTTTPLSKFVQPNAIQKRPFNINLTGVTPLTLKILIGSLIAAGYVLYQQYIRAAFKQRGYITKKLHAPAEPVMPPLTLERETEQKILTQYFGSPPSGPSVIIGPEGAGKSGLLKQIVQNRKMVIWMDLKQNPVATGEEFLVSFINNSGYLWHSSGNLWSAFLGLGRTQSQAVQFNQEADLALTAISDVLRNEKEKGWQDGVPVIVLDDIHRLGSCNDMELQNAKVSDDVNFLKFIDWCVHVSDSKLAHVVFMTSYTFAHLALDTHAAFRRRRSLIAIDYAAPGIVKALLNKLANQEFSKKPLSPEAIDTIVGCVGGQMEDLDRLITGLRRGDAYYNILRSMLTDSIAEIEDHLEGILEEASKSQDEQVKQRAYERYIRFWNLMEALHKDGHVNKRSIIVNIFNHQHTEELESLLASHTISFVNERFPDSIGKKTDTIFTLLNSSLDSVALTPGSPKLRMAFGLLLKDERMIKQRKWVGKQIEIKSLREKEKDCLQKRKTLNEEIMQYLLQLEKISAQEDKLAAIIPLEEIQKRKEKVLEQHKQAMQTLENENKALEEIRAEITAKLAE